MKKQLRQLLLVLAAVVSGAVISTLLQDKVSAFQPVRALVGTSLTLQDANGKIYATIQQTATKDIEVNLINTGGSISQSRVKIVVAADGQSSSVSLKNNKGADAVVMSHGFDTAKNETNSVQLSPEDSNDDSFVGLLTFASNSLVEVGHAENPFHVILRRNIKPETSGGKMLGIFVSDGSNPPTPATYQTWLGANTKSLTLPSTTPICAAPAGGLPPAGLTVLCPGVPTPPKKP